MGEGARTMAVILSAMVLRLATGIVPPALAGLIAAGAVPPMLLRFFVLSVFVVPLIRRFRSKGGENVPY
jgi:hypothetical protein